MSPTSPVGELRLVVTAGDYDNALRFYRDVLGLSERAAYTSPGGRVTILEAGRATLEIADASHAAYIDEVEVGRRVAGHIRVAFEVPDAHAATDALAAAGAQIIAPPTRTPWQSLNSRLAGPAGLQLTLFQQTPAGPDLAADAAATALAAAEHQGVRVAELTDLAQYEAAERVLTSVWRPVGTHRVMTAELMRALGHAGNYIAGVYAGEVLIGAAVAFFGPGHLHSHVAGVLPGRHGGGIGYILKQHQRAWALARGVTEIRWTFDPLVRRNAYFNLHKLGGEVTAYLPDFYGVLPDSINEGDASDRLYLHWRLGSPRAVAAAHGERTEVDATAARDAGALVLLDRVPAEGATEEPVPAGPLDLAGRPLLVAVPADIEDLRSRDRTRAALWRQAVRAALTGALDAGYRVSGISRDGFYLLQP
jgi:predicted GNAT superfamily acetyltransferase/predicted enzyme related to lactoylglutathione lyase